MRDLMRFENKLKRELTEFIELTREKILEEKYEGILDKVEEFINKEFKVMFVRFPETKELFNKRWKEFKRDIAKELSKK